MREIKFRLWNPSGKKFLYDVENVYECLMQQHVYDGTQPTRNIVAAYNHKADGMVWQQFTGLHDKNGKEIYEGDVVKSGKEYNSYTGMNSEIYGGHTYEVKNNGWRFYLNPQSVYSVDLQNMEVIGNIYENPELLK